MIDDARRARLTSSLLALGLIAPDEQPAITALAGGISSEIYRVELRSGAVCVKSALPQLRVSQEWLAPVERNAFEVMWFNTVRVFAPRSVPLILAEDRPAGLFVMSYLPPDRFPNWKTELLRGAIDSSAAHAVGGLLASIHAATAHDEQLAAQFADAAAHFYALRLDPYFNSAALVHPSCAARLHELVERTASSRLALVHGDYSPKNILIGPDGPVVLDAETACYGDPAFDLAFCLNHLLLKSRALPAWRQRYIDCFDATAAAYLRGVRWETAATLESRAATLLPALLLARIDGKSPVEYLTDEDDRRAVREAALALLRQPVERLAAVKSAWLNRTAP